MTAVTYRKFRHIGGWDLYPIGTLAHAIGGGHWERVENGWKWMTNGGTFPRPGADAFEVSVPCADPVESNVARGEAVARAVQPPVPGGGGCRMNAHVETLREMERYADPESRPALQAAIAALEAQGEAVAWEGRIKATEDCGPGDWQKVSKEIFDLNQREELASLVFEYRELYSIPPSSPAMRAAVEALKEISTMSELSGDNITDARIAAKEALAHPEVKKLMGETK